MTLNDSNTNTDEKVFLIGGGLSSALVALALHHFRPQEHRPLSIEIFEKNSELCGNHTWSCHELELKNHPWAKSILNHSWSKHWVYFPNHTRVLQSAYHTIFSTELAKTLTQLPNTNIHLHSPIQEIAPHSITLQNGNIRHATWILDGRGTDREHTHAPSGYQKFLGLEVKTRTPHHLSDPILMDATVVQRDGFRFMYVLPFTVDTLLIEDTYYSDHPDLDFDEIEKQIFIYAQKKGWEIQSILRRESGVLPLPLESAGSHPVSPLSIGMRGGFFHPTTSYSLPMALRLAEKIAKHIYTSPTSSTKSIQTVLNDFQLEVASKKRYFILLNRMLFRCAEPEKRYLVLKRFYQLGEPLIQRFYSGELTRSDQLRILCGKPPVPILKAIQEANYVYSK